MKISVILDALTGSFDTDIQRSRKNLDREMKKIRKNLEDSAKRFALWSAAATGALAAVVHQSAEAAKEIKNLAQVSNVSVEDFQRYAFAARSVGIEQEKFGDILKDVEDRVGDFLNTGGGPMLDFFEKIAPQIGVTAQQFKNLSGQQALQLYFDSLQKANLSQAEFTFYLEAMASDATLLIPLLRDGGRAMQEQADQADRLGLILSKMQIDQLASLNDQMLKAGQLAKSTSLQFSAALAPAIQLAIEKVEEYIEVSGGIGPVAEKAAMRTVSAYAFVADAIDGVGRVFKLVSTIGIATFESLRAIVLDFASAIINGPVQAINLLIEQANRIPGVDFGTVGQSDLGASLEAQARQSRMIMAQAQQDFERLLLEPLAGSAFMAELENRIQEISNRAVTIDINTSTDDSSTSEQVLSQHELNELLQEAKKIYEDTRTPLERYNAEIERLNMLRDTMFAGEPLLDEETYQRAVDAAQEQFERLSKAASDSFFDIEEAAKQASRNIQDSLAQFLFDPFDQGLKGMLDGFLNTMRRIAAEAAASEILSRVFGSAGGLQGVVDTAFGTIFGGGRAAGGPVVPGQAYMVGEKREPELFIPKSAGTVMPMKSVGKGDIYLGGITIMAQDVESFRRSQGQVQNELVSTVRAAQRRNG